MLRQTLPGASGHPSVQPWPFRPFTQLHQHMLGGCKEWTDPTDWRRNRRTALRVSPLHLSCTCLRRPHPLQLQTQPPTCSSPASMKGTTRTRPIAALHLS